MRINLPKPANWQDFENLCFKLWKQIWGDPNAKHNGRNGQTQNGVDIYGKAPFDDHYTGIQCKGKNSNYDKKLTSKEIDKECDNAKEFKPPIGIFIMATTSPRDVKIQEHCRKINTQKVYNFKVDTWFWDDIEEEVQCRPDIMKEFYSNENASELVNEIKLSRVTSSNKLHAFFSRPGLLDFLNKLNVNLLNNITYELATNAFEHGKATCFNLSVEGNKIIYKDNGKMFNPITLLEKKIKQGGSLTLKYAKEVFDLNYRYERENIFELTYKGGGINRENEDCYSINLNVHDVFGRNQAEDLAFREISKMPGDANNVIIDICGKNNPAISIVFTFFDTLKKLIRSSQCVRVYLPYGCSYYYSNLVERFKDSCIEFKLKN